ncbi:MAG: phosphatidylserine decarboxylase [bacterium]|nr:phosphatidylserine decarboxylase [bacterium]
MVHQYIDRTTSQVVTEKLIADRAIQIIYSTIREKSRLLFDLLTSARTSDLLGFFNYDNPLANTSAHLRKIIANLNIDLDECVEPLERMDSPRKLFERKIRFWETRPMPEDPAIVVSPADSRMLVGSFSESSIILLKEKFFHYEELIGRDKQDWIGAFQGGDYAVFRLTPEKYHYNHVPVSGCVVDFYDISGRYHSCNPAAVISLATPYSKNKRTITVIDTDVPDGSGIGLVMMIELVALMIGDIQQCYSVSHYDNPLPVRRGLFLRKGCPKSLFRPGSSVDMVIFQKERIRFDRDILQNLKRSDVVSRYTHNFQQPLVETDVTVRSPVAKGI